jgi:hypothetical protein
MTNDPSHDPRALAQRRLEAMVGRGELTLAEFSDRAARIWSATCPAELEVALSGLPAPGPGVTPVPPAEPLDYSPPASPATRPGSAITVDEEQKRSAILGTLKREGRWQLPDDYRLTSWFGEIYLDAREAVVDRPRTHLKLDLWGANAKILLPPGVSVTVTGNRTWSELKVDEGRYDIRGGPHLDIEINGFMAGVKIKILGAGERVPATWKWF